MIVTRNTDFPISPEIATNSEYRAARELSGQTAWTRRNPVDGPRRSRGCPLDFETKRLCFLLRFTAAVSASR